MTYEASNFFCSLIEHLIISSRRKIAFFLFLFLFSPCFVWLTPSCSVLFSMLLYSSIITYPDNAFDLVYLMLLDQKHNKYAKQQYQ
ncbi:hypothetical protein BX070DRAFT_69908 [Coemansia spiralis]|nr:hypothetical protein BX070DRAFT_69908 [Coemansia spiralis]